MASVATLGVAGFFVWRAVKKKKANKALEENTQDADYVEVQGTEDTQDAPQDKPKNRNNKLRLTLTLKRMWCTCLPSGVLPVSKTKR